MGSGVLIGSAGGIVQLTGGVCPVLRLLHGTEVKGHYSSQEGKDHGDDAIEVQGDGVEQGLDGALLRHAAGGQVAGHGCQPAAEGEEDAPGGRGGMYQEGGLLVGQAHAVVERTGHRSGHHAAEGAGGEYHNTQQPGEEGGGPLGLDNTPLLDHDVHEAGDTAGALNHVDQGTDEQHGHEDDGIAAAGEGVYQAVEGVIEAGKQIEVCQNKGREEEADEQRNKDVLQHEGQYDGNQGWDDG